MKLRKCAQKALTFFAMGGDQWLDGGDSDFPDGGGHASMGGTRVRWGVPPSIPGNPAGFPTNIIRQRGREGGKYACQTLGEKE